MKKVIAILLICVFTLTGCSNGSNQAAIDKYGSDVLKVFNVGEYIGENVIKNFEKQFGVKVIYDTYDSNEAMYTKIQTGESYDILVPSDYMIERLILEKKLTKLDKRLIPNMSNLYKGVKNLSFDANNDYSVPYLWGSVGLVYNHNNVPKKLVEKEGYNILKNTEYKGKIYMYDSERDSFMVAFKALGYSMNTEKESEIQDAYNWLGELDNTMDPAYVTDEVIDGMANGLKDIAVVYSGDATYVLSQNPDMSYCMPHQGTNLWCDSMVIPTNAPNPKLAHEFINYILTYEASMDNSKTIGYASSNKDVFDDLSKDDGLYANNEAYVPRVGYEKDEVFKHNEILIRRLSDLWIKVKAAN